MTNICTRPGCEIQHEGQAYCPTCTAELKQRIAERNVIAEDCRNGHHSWTERGHGPCSACGEPTPPPVLPQLECGCLQGACHGEHTITRLSAVQSWMLAHDWTEISEGDSGWMWQHTTGRKVAVFRDLTDPHAWEGLIGRLAVAHARHPGDIEREIRGGEEPVRLADEQLRRITEYVHPDEGTAYVRPWLHSMAAELLAARARVTELEANADDHAVRQRAQWDRIVELEAAQREPIGYLPLVVRDGGRLWLAATEPSSRGEAESRLMPWRGSDIDCRVVELHEPRPVTE